MNDDDPNSPLYRQWAEVRKVMDDTPVQINGYYASNKRASSWIDDINLCIKEAAEGNERAQRFFAEFMKQRMAG